MKKKIAIVGATGKTGIPLVKLLSKENVSVKAMLHSPNNNPFSNFTNVEVNYADFNDDASLSNFFKGCESIYLVTPPSENMAKIAINTAKIAIANGVTHIVKLSALSTSASSTINLLQQHAEAEEAIKTMNVQSAFIHPHFFLENLLQDIETVKKIDAIYSPLGDTAIAPVSVLDIAACASTILTNPILYGKTYQLTGPKAFTYSEYAKELSQLLQYNINYYAVPFDAVLKNMINSKMPKWLANNLVELMRSWTLTRTKIVTSDVEKITGYPAIGLPEFLTLHLEQFKREHHSYNDY